uniref:Bm353 n=1 Tax=Brugia malayi TaxID=6279 RepID=A0A0J9XRJ8_BRUMA|nr:Bm353 [Brugia malayi]
MCVCVCVCVCMCVCVCVCMYSAALLNLLLHCSICKNSASFDCLSKNGCVACVCVCVYVCMYVCVTLFKQVNNKIIFRIEDIS